MEAEMYAKITIDHYLISFNVYTWYDRNVTVVFNSP